FRAKFKLSMLWVYKPPPLQVETVLTTEEETGQRMDSQGFCKLVGVATVVPVNDLFLNAFLDLPTQCIARLSAKILISTKEEEEDILMSTMLQRQPMGQQI
ncbi:hypothetical protein KI387_020406, partial [Taxus chinensis]